MLRVKSLTDQQIADFHRDGFVVSRAAFDASDARQIEAWTTELAEQPEIPGRHWVYHETSQLDGRTDLINRIENMSPYDNGFAELAEVLAGPVGQLLGEEAVLFKDKINFKMPGGDGFKPHQDSQAGWETYAKYFISVLVTIDEATIENGCLKMAPRDVNHLVGREWEPLSEEETAGMDFEPIPTRPGDVVYFDCYAPHASEPNFTKTTRRLYFATYNRLSEGDHRERYYADKHESFPPDIEREAGREYVYRV